MVRRLQELRKSKNLSQQELAEVLNVQRNTISRYENGSREPDYDTLCKLADYFHVSTDYLLGNTDEPNHPGIKKDPLDGLKFALWGHEDITDDMLDDVREFALYIEHRKRGKRETENEKP